MKDSTQELGRLFRERSRIERDLTKVNSEIWEELEQYVVGILHNGILHGPKSTTYRKKGMPEDRIIEAMCARETTFSITADDVCHVLARLVQQGRAVETGCLDSLQVHYKLASMQR